MNYRERIEQYIQMGIDEGAELVVDGRGFKLQGHEEGFFIGPTFFDHVKPSFKSYQDEIFGPVLQMVRAKDFEEAVRLGFVSGADFDWDGRRRAGTRLAASAQLEGLTLASAAQDVLLEGLGARLTASEEHLSALAAGAMIVPFTVLPTVFSK